jgi:DNA-directed RNA polymerase sigma subunit (sigma70/sigma32)
MKGGNMQLTDKNLSTLKPREERVVRMLKGFGMKCKHSFAEVGLQFSLTDKEVKRIAASALKKLKKLDFLKN